MFGMGMTEILVILVVAMLFLGPEKLPEAAKQLSKGIRDLRKQTREFQDTIENDTQIGGAIRDIKSALRGDEIRRPPVRKVPPVEKPALVAVEDAAAIAAVAGADPESVAETVPEPEPVAVAVADAADDPSVAVADDPSVAVADDDLAKLIRPASGAVRRGQPN